MSCVLFLFLSFFRLLRPFFWFPKTARNQWHNAGEESNKQAVPDVFRCLCRVVQRDGYQGCWSLYFNAEKKRLVNCVLYVSFISNCSLCLDLHRTFLVLGFKQVWNWSRDGIHFSSEGSKVVVEEILKVLEEADWEPGLQWNTMATEFEDISTTINPGRCWWENNFQCLDDDGLAGLMQWGLKI